MSVSVVTVKPGRYEDFLKQHRIAEALLKNAGANNLRLIVGLTAGEASGSMVSTWEADTFKDYGKVTDAFFANGGAELMMELNSADSPITGFQSSTFVDVPH